MFDSSLFGVDSIFKEMSLKKLFVKWFMFGFLLVVSSCVSSSDSFFSELPVDVVGLMDDLSLGDFSSVKESWNGLHPSGVYVDGHSVYFVYYSDDETVDKVSLSANLGLDKKDYDLVHDRSRNVYVGRFLVGQVDGFTYTFLLHRGKKVERVLDPLNDNISYGRRVRSIIRTVDSDKSMIRVYEDWKPSGVNVARNVYVCLPPGYFMEEDRSYPVLYMHDAQQIFDSEKSNHGGWKVDTTLERMVSFGEIEPIIIVGVENRRDRTNEFIGYSAYYGQDDFDENADKIASFRSYSDGYMDFVTDQVKPFIDDTFRTKPGREFTAIAGSSFGASASIYIGYNHNELFSMVGAFSGGNYERSDRSRREKNFYNAYPYLYEEVIPGVEDMKIYLDCGGEGVDAIFLPRTEDMYKVLMGMGYVEGVDLLYDIDVKAGHNERAWAERFPNFFIFMFGKE